ncbi:MAG: hypothetical protein EXR05_04640 [Acetobacteraceae bacterium]|nr:hypothetical protein [Acetobacteraceae bacterium]
MDGALDCRLENIEIGERQMRKMMWLEVVPDPFDVVPFDVVQLRRILWQPLGGEPGARIRVESVEDIALVVRRDT